MCVALAVLCLAPLYRWLEKRHAAAMAWEQADVDGDGIPLVDDLDADGDGLALHLDGDADGDRHGNAEQIVAFAKSAVGLPSDPLLGQQDSLLGRIGFVVCVDVPLRAWLSAGLPMARLLVDTVTSNPAWFGLDPMNLPVDPNFVRRVRNYRHLFEHSPELSLQSIPKAGDWAFFGYSHVALVIMVHGAEVSVIEAYGPRTAVTTSREVSERTGEAALFGGFRVPDALERRGCCQGDPVMPPVPMFTR